LQNLLRVWYHNLKKVEYFDEEDGRWQRAKIKYVDLIHEKFQVRNRKKEIISVTSVRAPEGSTTHEEGESSRRISSTNEDGDSIGTLESSEDEYQMIRYKRWDHPSRKRFPTKDAIVPQSLIVPGITEAYVHL